MGLLAVFAMRNYIQQETASNVEDTSTVQVLITTRHLSPNTPITRDDLIYINLPENNVSPDMVLPHEIIEVEGRRVRREIHRGGPLFHSDFLDDQLENASTIVPGRRLVTVGVSQVSGVAGLVKPGQRVDILYTTENKEKEAVTHLLLENVSVYAVDNRTIAYPNRGGRKANYSSLTLSVQIQEAAILSTASRSGTLTFAIRSRDDFKSAGGDIQVDQTNLLPRAKAANKKRNQPKK